MLSCLHPQLTAVHTEYGSQLAKYRACCHISRLCRYWHYILIMSAVHFWRCCPFGETNSPPGRFSNPVRSWSCNHSHSWLVENYQLTSNRQMNGTRALSHRSTPKVYLHEAATVLFGIYYLKKWQNLLRESKWMKALNGISCTPRTARARCGAMLRLH